MIIQIYPRYPDISTGSKFPNDVEKSSQGRWAQAQGPNDHLMGDWELVGKLCAQQASDAMDEAGVLTLYSMWSASGDGSQVSLWRKMTAFKADLMVD